MERLSGTIERITFYNPDNGYTVLKLLPDQRRLDAARDGTVAVVGMLPELSVGETVEFTGQWVENKTYGKQFEAERVTTVTPTSIQGLINYLGSGLVKGIGPVTAERIVNHFGLRTLEILDREPDRLYEIPAIKPRLIERLIDTWSKTQAARNAMIFLQGYGVSSRLATKIYNHYGDETIQKVQSDPYTLADDVYGVGFVKADAIAQNMGVAPDAPSRLRAGLRYALNQVANEGHVFLPREELLRTTAELLKIERTESLEQVLGQQLLKNELVADRAITGDGEQVEAIYLPVFYHCETRVAQRLRRLESAPSPIRNEVKSLHWDEFLGKLSRKSRLELSAQQQEAVRASLTNKISVLTGGPGTGKTTTLRMVIEALDELGFSFALASPTGRAAKRLSESTGRLASTIHRLLGYSPVEGYLKDQDDPLDADMVIVDETSMVDLVLFHHLLKALKPETHLLLVGDVNQLPSVGAGNVLRDIIDSGIAHVTRLETIFRQGKDSHIVVNAHRVNMGELPFMDNNSTDFFFFGADDPAKAAELVVDIVQNRLPAKFGVDPLADVQVIAPMYRGACGVDALNDLLQKALNGNRRRAERQFGGRIYRAGDKVMQTRNNYDKDVFNGDIGRIHGINFDENTVQVMMDDGMLVEYDWSEMDQLRHAFCISTHRSQGSEYPVVVIPILTQHYMMLQRNLLYTAITRAKKIAVLVGSRRAVAMAVKNNKVAERYSNLRVRLRNPHFDEGDIDDEPF
ncbi:MAG: ATP-dependent RecD-like DNA helicase [Chloroflexota bacterium]|nr:MAG: ATP-dependent RecD-like DNA helicase [Chloroflexota bacterium]